MDVKNMPIAELKHLVHEDTRVGSLLNVCGYSATPRGIMLIFLTIPFVGGFVQHAANEQ